MRSAFLRPGAFGLALMVTAGLLAGCGGRGSEQTGQASSVPATGGNAAGGGAPASEAGPADQSGSGAEAGSASAATPGGDAGSAVAPAGPPAAPEAGTGSKPGAPHASAASPKQAGSAAPGPGVSPAAGGGSAKAGPSGSGTPAGAPSVPKPGDAPSPAAPGGPAKYDPGANDTQIVFGSIASLTGVAGFIQPQGGRAYFKYVNDKFGGVNGRKLVLNIYDDQWDVTRHAALARQAVEQDKVFAFTAQMGVLTDHGAVPYLEEKKIPVIGGDSVDVRAWGASAMFFPQSELEAIFGGRLAGRFAASQGCKRVAAQSYNVDESTKWAASFKKGLEDAGFKGGFVYEGQNSLAETDFTAYAAQIRTAQADCMTMGQFDTHTIRMRQALKQVGHTLRMFQPSTFYSPALRDAGLSEGDYGLLGVDIMENAANNPAMAEFVGNVEKYEPSLRGKVNGWAINAWAAAKIAVEAVKRMGNNLTRENLLQTLNTFTDVDLGIVPPVTFRPGVNPGSRCGNLIQIKNGKFVTVQRNLCI